MTSVIVSKTLQSSAGRLSANDRGHVFDFLWKLQDNPANPSLSMERVQRAIDPKIWSARVSQGLRAVLHRDGDTFVVLYAGPHDEAYRWAEKRKVEQHPVTGALQVVEAAEVVEQQVAAHNAPVGAPGLFNAYPDDYLLGLGVPPDLLPAVRNITSDDALDAALDYLPEEAAEALIELSAGKAVGPATRRPSTDGGPSRPPLTRPASAPDGLDYTANPDTRRRFFLLERDDDLQHVLEAPLAAWIAFLHPSQRRLVEGHFNGPVKVTGSAGTGKTVVAMHRARELARQGKRVLLTSYVTTLCQNVEQNLRLLCSSQELARITVRTVDSQALALARSAGEDVYPADKRDVDKLFEQAASATDCPFGLGALRAEWEAVIQTHGITTWDEYRVASRAGRGRPLSARERKQMWDVFARVRNGCQARGMLEWPDLCRRARELLENDRAQRPYDAVIVDEVQDLGPQELRFVAALAGDGPNRLMLVGDDGQRLYARAFSLRSLGIDVRGRSYVLRINYRTTEQIRRFADRVLGDTAGDLEGGVEDRRGCHSVLRGPAPVARGFRTESEQHAFVAERIRRCLAD